MFVAERIISVVAPHTCINCGSEGPVLCGWCSYEVCQPLPSRCYRCNKSTKDFAVCVTCRSKTPLRHVFVVTSYDGVPKNLISKLKFGRASAAAVPVGKIMAEGLPFLDRKTLIVPVPTATSRVRSRGYDQSVLISRSVMAATGLRTVNVLSRQGQTRQLGATRKQRIAQLEGEFFVKNLQSVRGQQVLLVDDVMTTGATLETAARVLRRAGAKQVNAAVFAHRI